MHVHVKCMYTYVNTYIPFIIDKIKLEESVFTFTTAS